jgi:hypothetical protein
MKKQLIFILFLFGLLKPILACSGPGAPAAIDKKY